jgi:hypothetical protein
VEALADHVNPESQARLVRLYARQAGITPATPFAMSALPYRQHPYYAQVEPVLAQLAAMREQHAARVDGTYDPTTRGGQVV